MAESAGSAAVHVHVSPGGDDAHRGTRDEPLATPVAAQKAARKARAEGSGDVTVELAPGTYYLDEPLVFAPGDGGTGARRVVWRAGGGGEAILSGGTPIREWTVERNGHWTAPLPRGAASARLLAGRDGPRVRARRPDLDGQWPYFAYADWNQGKTWSLTDAVVTVDPETTEGLTPGAEIVFHGSWATSRKVIDAVDGGRLRLRAPHAFAHKNINPFDRKIQYYYFEGAPAHCDAPGEWCIDGDRVRYVPRPGEVPEAITLVLATTDGPLVRLTGSEEAPVENLHFQGLTVAHADWQLPRQGFNGKQACYCFPDVSGSEGVPQPEQWKRLDVEAVAAAVRFDRVRDCSFTDGRVASCAGTGIHVGAWCRGVRIARNEILDCGATGIQVGENLRPAIQRGELDEAACFRRMPKACHVERNRVHRIGRTCSGGIGIMACYVDDLRIDANEVFDLPYTGISVGYMWGRHDIRVGRRVRISRNHVHDVMQAHYDGGGIYVLGWQPGSTVTRNLIHSIPPSKHMGHKRGPKKWLGRPGAPIHWFFTERTQQPPQGKRFHPTHGRRSIYLDGWNVKGWTVGENILNAEIRDKAVDDPFGRKAGEGVNGNLLGVGEDDPRFGRMLRQVGPEAPEQKTQ